MAYPAIAAVWAFTPLWSLNLAWDYRYITGIIAAQPARFLIARAGPFGAMLVTPWMRWSMITSIDRHLDICID